MDPRTHAVLCDCGHRTRAVASRGEVDPLLVGVELSELRGWWGRGWRWLPVALALRFRLSRARIQEFLREWLGVELSIGTIHQTIHESFGRRGAGRRRVGRGGARKRAAAC